MKNFKLEVDYAYDFDLFGLVSSSKDHKLAWALNKQFNIRLVKQQDLSFDIFSKGRLVISNYLYTSEHSTCRLYRNKSIDLSTLKKPFLAPDIKEYDFLIQISGALNNFCTQELLNRFKLVPLIQYVKKFDPDSLEFKENLMF
ncbi:IPExxxVDY family protein [Adhaeribacter aquaticus]|uniref:IPExxxVDY family protein n=1 Tax=Adhaeribacter aquaticus TaxID=299567 RepID=UPI000405CC81|nr:IPExxxVDY family protein [Adhaeribacter aquaticus]